jgi:16S rRNA processing protein RimM
MSISEAEREIAKEQESKGAADEVFDLAVGEVSRPLGLTGDVKIEPLTDFPDRFLQLVGCTVRLKHRSGRTEMAAVKGCRLRGRGAVVSFEGYGSREAADALRGALVMIPESSAAPLPEGHYYWHQILGLRAITVSGEDLGKIENILRTPAHDVYVAQKAMIPAVKEIVREIDLAAGRMIVDLPEEEGG